MLFLLFLLVNAAHYLQPAAFYPELESLSLYQVLSLLCLALSLPQVCARLSPRALAEQPISLCVVGLLFAIVVSNGVHMDLYGARRGANEFLKILVYYLLFVTHVNSVQRLRQFLLFFAGTSLVLTVLPLLQWHGVIDVPVLAALEEHDVNVVTGQIDILARLRTIGVFNDPNDFCLLLVTSMVICAYWLTDKATRLSKPLFVLAIAVSAYALVLTRSRGGFLALTGGTFAFLTARFGWRKAMILGCLALPALGVLAAGRQTSIDLSAESSGQSRLALWREGIGMFLESPLFGAGTGTYADEAGQVAHNSFLHCFAEMGLMGGMLFLGAFAFAVGTLFRLGSRRFVILDEQTERLRPYVLAITAAYAIGMLTLSRQYVVPTYMILALAAAYLRMTPVHPPLPNARFSLRLVPRIVGLSAAFLIGLHVFVRVFIHWS